MSPRVSVGEGGNTHIKEAAEQFKVANSISPIPAKLVKRIRALEFVEMRELLPDNIAMTERLAALPSGIAHNKPPSEREIGGDRALITWVSSFSTYVAIVAESHPERVVDMLAYMRLLIREASKFGGAGWLTYDSVFRRNNTGKEARWNYLDASLHQVYIASLRDKVVTPCRHCQEIDHSSANCAVAAFAPQTLPSQADQGPSFTAKVGRKGKRPTPYTRQRPICTSWNAGGCRFPGKCSYDHCCSICEGPHPAIDCRDMKVQAAGQRGPGDRTQTRSPRGPLGN